MVTNVVLIGVSLSIYYTIFITQNYVVANLVFG